VFVPVAEICFYFPHRLMHKNLVRILVVAIHHQPCRVLSALPCLISLVVSYQPCRVLSALSCLISLVVSYQPCRVLSALPCLYILCAFAALHHDAHSHVSPSMPTPSLTAWMLGSDRRVQWLYEHSEYARAAPTRMRRVHLSSCSFLCLHFFLTCFVLPPSNSLISLLVSLARQFTRCITPSLRHLR